LNIFTWVHRGGRSTIGTNDLHLGPVQRRGPRSHNFVDFFSSSYLRLETARAPGKGRPTPQLRHSVASVCKLQEFSNIPQELGPTAATFAIRINSSVFLNTRTYGPRYHPQLSKDLNLWVRGEDFPRKKHFLQTKVPLSQSNTRLFVV